MPDMLAICHWLETSSLGGGIAQSAWIFPTIESIHMFGIIALVGATSILDLRLMGLALKQDSVSAIVGGSLRWAWGGFIVMFVTGSLMFVSEATRIYTNVGFRVKMLLLVLAGLNALIFHSTVYRGVRKWEHGGTPMAVKFAGAFSIVFWFAAVAMGRWIAFF
jgi:hypothetical protein